MPRKRQLPADGLASDRRWWMDNFDLSKKVVRYTVNAAADYTVVEYHDTVSAANAAAAGNIDQKVAANFYHEDFTLISIGARRHTDATVDLPAWIDAEPAQ